MSEHIDLNHQKRKESRAQGSGFSSLLHPKILARMLLACFLLFGLHLIANLEGTGQGSAVTSAVASPKLPGLNPSFPSHEKLNLSGFVSSNPDNLLTMTGQDIAVLFEVPDLTWNEAPTVVWQYRAPECVMDIYMASMDQNVSEAPVIHYELRGKGGTPLEMRGSRNQCIQHIADQNNPEGFEMADLKSRK